MTGRAEMSDAKQTSVALFSPGWPLNKYPNGIVAYINNIISGFDNQVIPTIVTAKLDSRTSDISTLDLAPGYKNKSYVNKLCNRVLLSGVANEYIENMCRDYGAKQEAKVIVEMLNSFQNRIDVIEIEESFGKAKYLVKKLSIPIVTRLHGPWFIIGQHLKLRDAKDYQFRTIAEGDAIKLSHGVTAPSLDVLERVRDYYDCQLPLATVIPNPVSTVPLKEQWLYQPKFKPSILVVGRFDLVKGGDLAIDAFRIIASKNKDVELLFVGPEREVIVNKSSYTSSSYVDAFIPEEPIKKRIKFLGHCSFDEIVQLRRKTTITLIPSRYETFSISLAEALAAGSPVVANNVGGISELVINGFNGLLAEPQSAESMAENILRLLDDPEKMKFMSKNAINDSKQRFSPEVVAKQTADYYRTVIDKY